MSSWLETIDPDVRQVLEDVAQDRRSKLFRFDRSRAAHAPFAGIEPVSAKAAGWRPAERHLLETYREEVWLLVHAACLHKMSLDESVSSVGTVEWHRYKGRRSTGTHIANRSRALAQSHRLDDLHIEARGLLQKLALGLQPHQLSYGVFATAARQLYDTHSTRLLAASVANLLQHHEVAEQLASSVAQASLRSDMGYSAWSILGCAQSQLREASTDAAISFKRAFLVEPDDLPMAANTMMASIQAGEVHLAIEMGEFLDQLVDEDDSLVVELRRQYSARHSAMRGPHRCNPETLHRAREALGLTSRAILDAVFR